MKKLIRKGLWGIYVDYPLHSPEVIEGSGIKLPVGHAGFALIDLNGNSEYYDYGQYSYRGVGSQKNSTPQGNFVKRRISNKNPNESPEDYVKRVGQELKKLLGEQKVVVSIMDLPNYSAAKDELTKLLSNRKDYSVLADRTCSGVARHILNTGSGFLGRTAWQAKSGLMRGVLGPIFGTALDRLPVMSRPPLSHTYTIQKNGGRLIPKAQFGTGLFRKGLDYLERGYDKLTKLGTNAFTSKPLLSFSNNNRKRELRDLQNDLKKLGYYNSNVDNLTGPKTRKAIAAAKADGYVIDMNKFMITKSGKKNSNRLVPKLNTEQNDITNMQQLLQKKGYYPKDLPLTGKMDKATKNAVTIAESEGYYFKNGKLKAKISLNTDNIRRIFNRGYSDNLPLINIAKDMWYSFINNLEPSTTGSVSPSGSGAPATLIHNKSDHGEVVTDVPTAQKRAMRAMIKYKGTPKRGGWTSTDYRNLTGTYTGGNRDFIERTNILGTASPITQIEHAMGLFNWHTDKDGNVIVTDAYDWDQEDPAGLGWYTDTRIWAREHGTKPSAPKSQKITFAINLGKPENWD